MEILSYTFNMFNQYASEGIYQALYKCNPHGRTPILICVGSDMILGDSLGPLVGIHLRDAQLPDNRQRSGIRQNIYKTDAPRVDSGGNRRGGGQQ